MPCEEQFKMMSADDEGNGLHQGLTTSNWVEIMMKVLLKIQAMKDLCMQITAFMEYLQFRHTNNCE